VHAMRRASVVLCVSLSDRCVLVGSVLCSFVLCFILFDGPMHMVFVERPWFCACLCRFVVCRWARFCVRLFCVSSCSTDLCIWYSSSVRGFVRVFVGSLCVDGLGFVFVCFVFHLVRRTYIYGIGRACAVLGVSLSVRCASIDPSCPTDLCAWYSSSVRGFVRVFVGSLCVCGLCFVFVCFVFYLVPGTYVYDSL
jgi:hypothetical protein